MKRIFKVLILTAVLLISAATAVVAIALEETFEASLESSTREPELSNSSTESSTQTSDDSSRNRQEIARTKADADLYEVTLSEGRPILTELLQARMERYRKENNTDKATSDAIIIARILAQDAKHLGKDEE